MSDIADRYISKGGRTPDYDKTAYTNDLMTISGFLAWAEQDGAYFGGHEAKDAFKAMCRMMDMDIIELRNIMLGRPR